MKCSPATPGLRERVRGKLVGDLEALGLGVARRARRGRRSPAGRRFRARWRRRTASRRPCAGCRSRGSSRAARLRPLSWALAHEALEQLGPVAELQLQKARAGERLLGSPANPVVEAAGALGFSTAPSKEVGRGGDPAARQVTAGGERPGDRDRAARPSTSNTRRVSGSSPAVTSSPVRQQTFSIPCIAAPIRSASSASRLRSRQTSCMTGSTPASRSADRHRERRAVGVRGGVVSGVESVDEGLHRLELAADLRLAAAVDHRHLGRDDELARGELALKERHPAARTAQPAGTCRSRPLIRFSHEEVPLRVLSTGGRRSSM